jgi:hypothetical protein
MNAHKIMIIRHAERPCRSAGVTESGTEDKDDLTVRGWQRAGALVRFFNPIATTASGSVILRPEAIFATNPTAANPSRRPLHTVKLLAEDMNLRVNKEFCLYEEDKLVDAAKSAASVVLISWHHERIDNIAKSLGVTTTGSWPDLVYDRVWVFDRISSRWQFTESHQRLLPGDT